MFFDSAVRPPLQRSPTAEGTGAAAVSPTSPTPLTRSVRAAIDLLRYTARDPRLATWFAREQLRALTGRWRRDGAMSLPLSVTFRLTSACNLRCTMCRFPHARPPTPSSLPVAVWKTVVDDLAASRPHITLTGGEPLLYRELPGLLGHIRRRGLCCTLVTNGTQLARLAPVLLAAPPNVVVVSIDGPRPVHDRIRGRAGTYDAAVSGIEALIAGRAHHRPPPLLVINSAITAESCDQLDAVRPAWSIVSR